MSAKKPYRELRLDDSEIRVNWVGPRKPGTHQAYMRFTLHDEYMGSLSQRQMRVIYKRLKTYFGGK